MYNKQQIIDKILETIIVELITEKGLSHCTERTLACLKDSVKTILRDICQNLKKLENLGIRENPDSFTDELKSRYLKEMYFPKNTYCGDRFDEFLQKQKKLNQQFPLNDNRPIIEKLNLIPSNINLTESIKYESKEKSGGVNYEKTILMDTEIDAFIKSRECVQYKDEKWNYEAVKIDSLVLSETNTQGPIFSDEELYKYLRQSNPEFDLNDELADVGILDLICNN
ncbi:hypothetical protein CDIK_0028 [Cucumispora dikerogammari]|nr:hypothetical protein CDIK_0028 [Cucumispora dikerogammari]